MLSKVNVTFCLFISGSASNSVAISMRSHKLDQLMNDLWVCLSLWLFTAKTVHVVSCNTLSYDKSIMLAFNRFRAATLGDASSQHVFHSRTIPTERNREVTLPRGGKWDMKSYRFHFRSFKQDLFVTRSPIETHKTYLIHVTSPGINLFFCVLETLLLTLSMRRQLITAPTNIIVLL